MKAAENIQGTVFSNDRILVVQARSGTKYLAHDTRNYLPSGHLCLFAPKVTKVVFDLERLEDKRGVVSLQATHMQPSGVYETAVRELSTVESWEGGHGVLRRECDCRLFILAKSFGEAGWVVKDFIKPGDVVEHSVSFDYGRGYIASDCIWQPETNNPDLDKYERWKPPTITGAVVGAQQ